ncbi:MAG: rhomboid family intramembrane serine protease [Prolixibacteraceae bacterium]|nr:rhomboid family intramembrane serine protease [Prolixibacteraceae bacterium]
MAKLTFKYYPQPPTDRSGKIEKKIFRYSLVIPLIFLIIIWLFKLSEVFLDINLVHLGVYPRHIKGLIGILTSPLIHGDFAHLTGNSTSFIVLATALFYFYRRVALKVFLMNYFLSGLLLWVGGREVWHIGASGVIYGLAAFLFFSGLFRRDIRLLTISLIVTFLYGSFIWGLFPIEPRISWEGHLMGAASGTILSAFYYQYGPPKMQYNWDELDDDDDSAFAEATVDKDDESASAEATADKENGLNSVMRLVILIKKNKNVTITPAAPYFSGKDTWIKKC